MMFLPMFNRPDLLRLLLVRINMHHPIKDNRIKFSSRRFALLLGCDRTLESKARILAYHAALLAFWGHTKIHMLVPLRHAEWNALVQVVFAEALGSGIHRADQRVVVAVFFIEQGSGM